MLSTRLSTRIFASRSVTLHLVRGVVGFALLGVGLYYAERLGWWTAAPLLGALVMFRGCPSCWLMGLYETVVLGKESACRRDCRNDGSCRRD